MAFPGAHKVVQLPRGNSATVAGYTGLIGELFYNTELDRLMISDGATAGGIVFYNKADIDAMLATVSYGVGTGPMAETGTDVVNRVWPATAFAGFATKANPAFTGVPTAPTPSIITNTEQLANTAWVTNKLNSLIGLASEALTGTDTSPKLWPATAFGQYATKASPALTGIPTTPTPSSGVTTTQIVNAAWVSSYFMQLPSNSGASTDTVLPLGAIIVVDGAGSTPSRNSVPAAIAHTPSDATGYILSSSGTLMAGVWRQRGRIYISGAPHYLYQRVA